MCELVGLPQVRDDGTKKENPCDMPEIRRDVVLPRIFVPVNGVCNNRSRLVDIMFIKTLTDFAQIYYASKESVS